MNEKGHSVQFRQIIYQYAYAHETSRYNNMQGTVAGYSSYRYLEMYTENCCTLCVSY